MAATVTFQTDPRLAPARAALAITGLPHPDVTIAQDKPQIVAETEGPGMEVYGEYDPDTGMLWTSPGDLGMLSAVHEYAHAIWQHAAKCPHTREAIDHVLAALNQTPEVFEMELARAISVMIHGHGGYVDYLLNPNEMWARAVAQYVATRPDQDPAYTRQWNEVAHAPDHLDTQWTDEHFKPVMQAFDEVFPR